MDESAVFREKVGILSVPSVMGLPTFQRTKNGRARSTRRKQAKKGQRLAKICCKFVAAAAAVQMCARWCRPPAKTLLYGNRVYENP